MDDSPHISVIIPVYNVEKYLEKCLESVINQTLGEIEIICINDGSTDNSLQILEDFAQNDKRIKIINKENSGQGSARNIGMQQATGQYISFIDSDDWIDLNMYEKLYENAKTLKSEIVMCPIRIFDESTLEFKYDDRYFTLGYFSEGYDNRVFNHTETRDFLFKISVTPFNKLYNTNFLHEINAKFPENLIFEDNPFFYYIYLNARKVSLVRDYLYNYRVNRLNSTISKSNHKLFDIIEILKITRKIFIKTHNYDNYREYLNRFTIETSLNNYNKIDDKFKGKFFDLVKEYFKDMNLESDEINKLDTNIQNRYENVIKSDSNIEFELKEKIMLTKFTYNNKLKDQRRVNEKKLDDQRRVYEKKLDHSKSTYQERVEVNEQIIKKMSNSNSWKLTKPLRKIGTEIKRLKEKY
jgi:glycosyltransferase involved in cell wall biosynthesis